VQSKPGNQLGGIVIFLTDAKFKFTYPDGKVEGIQAETGEYLWFGDRLEHLPENMNNKNLKPSMSN
jgi:hypothetical protein